MAEDGCINSGIFQNLDVIGEVEFVDAVFTGNCNIGKIATTDTLTIKSRIKMPPPDAGSDDVDASTGTKVLVRQTDNTLRFEPKAESVFKTIIVDNQDNIVASNLTDSFTIKPGTNMTIQTDENSKTITFASSNGTNTQDLYKTIRVDGHNDLIPNTSTDILKFVGTNNIDIVPTGGELDGFLATITFGNVYDTAGNVNKKITLYNGGTAVDFVMVTTTPITPTDTLVQFQKETDNDTTITNLHNAINNHSAFTSKKANSGQSYSNELEITQRNNVTPLSNSTNFVDGIIVSNFSSIDVWNTQLVYNSVLHTNSNNIGQSLKLKNRDGVDVDFLMIPTLGVPSSSTNAIQFNKGGNETATVTNLSNAINSYRDFHSTLDLVNKIISVTIFSYNHPNIDDGNSSTTDSNRDTFEDTGNDENVSLITPNFSLVNQEIATLTIGLKDNKIIDDLVIGEDSTDMLLVNSETTFTSNTTFSNDVEITDNLQVDNLNINGNIISSTDTNGNIQITPDGTGTVVIPKIDINSGTIDGVTIGVNSVCTDLRVDNIKIDGNIISSTNGDINITPDGTGTVVIPKIDINEGNIDNTIIGATTAAAGTFTTLDVSDGNITNVGSIALDSIIADGSSFSFGSNWSAASQTCDDLGTVTTVDINGGNIDGTTINTSDITVPSGNKIDIQNATLTLADDQISGDKIEGGTIDSITILNLEGPMDTNNEVISNVNIVSGKLDNVTIGTTTPCTDLRVDNIQINGNTISSTDTNGDIQIVPNGTGKIDAGTVNIDSSGIIGNSNATLLGTISASTPLQQNIISVGTLTSLDISGDLSVDTNVLKVDTTNNKVGINKTTPNVALDVFGDVTMSGTLTIGSGTDDKRVTYLNSSNQINIVSTPSADKKVLAHTGGNLTWIDYGDVSSGGIDKSLVTDILSSPLDTDYYVGNDENNLFVSSGKSNFLEDVNIIDSVLRVDNSSGHSLILNGSTTNPTIESTSGTISFGNENLITTGTLGCGVLTAATGSSIGTLALANGSITDTNGAISFGNVNLTTTGNVGIGTTNPSGILHVGTGTAHVGSGNEAVDIIVGSSTGANHGITISSTNDGNIFFSGAAPADYYKGIVRYNHINNSMTFFTNGNERLCIDSAGNVGIGTTNPQSSLHVAGDRNNTTPAQGIHLGMNGGDAAIEIVAGSATTTCNSFIDFTKPNSDYRGRIIYHHTNNSTDSMGFYVDGGGEKMKIDSAGNVGIGTNNPAVPLHINRSDDGDVDMLMIETQYTLPHLGPAICFVRSSSILSRIRGIDDSSWGGGLIFETVNVDHNANPTGIGRNGTTIERMRIDKDGKLLLNKDIGGAIIEGNDANHAIYFRKGYDTTLNVLDFYEYGNIRFFTNGVIASQTEKMRIQSNGNVGIGTTNPGHKLDVYGVVASFGTELTSDDRIKYNKQDINGITAIDIINQLNPQKYEKIIEKPQNKNGVWIPTDAQWRSTERDATINETDDEGNVTTRPKWKWNNEIGLIAQDIKLINELQNSVTGEEVDESGNQTPLSLNYNYIFSYHIAATKQLISELNVEKTKVTTLETKVTTLETELAAIKTHLGL